MSPSRRRAPRARLTYAIALLLPAGIALGAGAQGGGKAEDAYERLSGEVLADTLLAGSAQSFRAPPWLELKAPSRGRESRTFASASWVLLSDEFGAGDRFAGSGSGIEARLDLRRPSGWGAAFAFSTADRGVFSVVDDRPVSIARYLVGATRTPERAGRWSISGGAGFAWNVFDVDAADAALDIEGAGGYAELRAVGLVGKRARVEASGRAVYWRGKDGLGGSGAELSIVLGVGMGFRF